MIKAVIFDIDGVLLDTYEANFKFFTDLMSYFGHNVPTREQFPELFHRPMKNIIEVLSQSADQKEIEKIWTAGRDHTIAYPFELLIKPQFLDKTIKNLSKNYTLGIVTSRTRKNIYQLPQIAELEEYFKLAVGFEDTENHKPHPEPLILASQKLQILPEECVYIGDAQNDVSAAKAAGMKAILFSKNISPDADAHTSVFSELPNLIKKFR